MNFKKNTVSKMKTVISMMFMLVVMSSTMAYAQTVDSTTTVTIPRTELQSYFDAVDSVRAENRNYMELLNIRQLEIKTLDFIVQQDSILIGYKDRRISMLETEIKLHTDYIDRINRRSWRNSKTLWFVTGMATVYISSIVLDNINGVGN
jgi:hypothetical protein